VGLALVTGVGAALGVAGWRVCGRSGQRCEDAGMFFPLYDARTARITGVMYDLNRNGLIETWAYRKGDSAGQFDIDRDEDGVIDRILVIDRYSTLRLQPNSR
jgi:hypothetical protein